MAQLEMANDPEVELRTPCCMAAGTSAKKINEKRTYNLIRTPNIVILRCVHSNSITVKLLLVGTRKETGFRVVCGYRGYT